MIDLKLPSVNPLMKRATISSVHATAGALLPVGSPLFDLYIDLSEAAPHDCPPTSRYRVSLREPLWLRELKCAAGDEVEVGAQLAVFTSDADAALSSEVVRGARLAIAGMMSEPDWWESPAID